MSFDCLFACWQHVLFRGGGGHPPPPTLLPRVREEGWPEGPSAARGTRDQDPEG